MESKFINNANNQLNELGRIVVYFYPNRDYQYGCKEYIFESIEEVEEFISSMDENDDFHIPSPNYLT